jgi:hypothetical protein
MKIALQPAPTASFSANRLIWICGGSIEKREPLCFEPLGLAFVHPYGSSAAQFFSRHFYERQGK